MIIAVTGGIGSGKSVVCRMVEAMGYDVYDCDSKARAIMDADAEIKRRIAEEVCAESIDADGRIDRSKLSAAVFSDSAALERLNAIVHAAVRDDIELWCRERTCGARPLFIETAILYQSGIDRMVDCVWEVTAPEDVRIHRVMERNSLTEDEVRARIASQDLYEPERLHDNVVSLINDGVRPLLPQVEALIR
ncbi:MAG: dephospho-CoA kinase [Muribaculaceae bacterium]|nr:dephospho-CoA kinase [Muribaculaceae bacterium]